MSENFKGWMEAWIKNINKNIRYHERMVREYKKAQEDSEIILRAYETNEEQP